jgi:hypothetical protein
MEQSAKAGEDRARNAEKEAQLRERIADRSKLGIGELADKNTPAGRTAARVEALEDQAKNARASGRGDIADNFTSQANALRGQLGQAGIIKSGEFGEDFPTNELPPMPSGPNRKWIDIYMRSPSFKYVDRLGPAGKRIQDMARARQAELEQKKTKRGINEFYSENGYINVKAKNSK